MNNLGIIKTVSAATSEIIHITPESVIHIVGIRTPKQREWMVKDFCHELTRKGMIVDAAIHLPDPGKDNKNVHVHMLVTMRSIGLEGFGNKVREWNDRKEYQKWTDRWSELGARQLERAGLKQEAERFRHGHLPRPQQLKLAKERGDDDHYLKLLNEKTEHRGPQANALKEEHGVELQIEKRQRNRQELYFGKVDVPREIREMYALSSDPADFQKKLAEKKIAAACVTKEEAHQSLHDQREAKTKGKYAPAFREKEVVLVTDRAQVYRLTEQTTGDNWKSIRAFAKKFDTSKLPTLTHAFETSKELAALQDLERQKFRDLVAVGDLAKREQRMSGDPIYEVKNGVRKATGITRQTVRVAATGARRGTRLLGSVGSLLDGLIPDTTPKTPEERKAFNERLAAKQAVSNERQRITREKDRGIDRER